jgi:hypothetical protein
VAGSFSGAIDDGGRNCFSSAVPYDAMFVEGAGSNGPLCNRSTVFAARSDCVTSTPRSEELFGTTKKDD